MLSLEQVHVLEEKINKACDLINLLKKENAALRRTIESSQKRMAELERFINEFKSEQLAIESGILSALKKLDELEDGIVEAQHQPSNTEKKSDNGSSQASLASGKKSENEQHDKNESDSSDTGVLEDSKDFKSKEKEPEAELDIF